jgi:hypothetical protein
LFSFFIESPLEESRRGGAKRPKSEARKPGKHPVRRALTADRFIVPAAFSTGRILDARRKDESLDVALERQGWPNRIAAFPR